MRTYVRMRRKRTGWVEQRHRRSAVAQLAIWRAETSRPHTPAFDASALLTPKRSKRSFLFRSDRGTGLQPQAYFRQCAHALACRDLGSAAEDVGAAARRHDLVAVDAAWT